MSVSMEELQTAQREMFALKWLSLGVIGLFVKLVFRQREVIAIFSYLPVHPLLQRGSR